MANTLEIVIKANDQASKTLLGVVDKASKGFSSLGGSLMKSGAIMTASTAPFAAVLVSTVKSAGQFEESMTNVGAVLGKTKSEMAGINAEVLALGTNSRAGPQAAADAFYDIVGGVADASTHMAILEASIATAEAGSADLGETTNALIAIMNSYGFSAEEAAYASDILTATVGAGVGSMGEFAAALPQVTGLANALGIEFDDVGASMAFMTTKGFSASQSATQLRASMTALMNPNEQMKTALREIGFASGEAAVEQLGLAGAYQALAGESGTFQSNMAGTIGSVEALQAVLSMTDDEFNAFVEDFKEGSEGATDAARQIQLDSLAAQTDLLKSSMEGLKITIGMALIPSLTRLVTGTTRALTVMRDWAAQHPHLTRALGQTIGVLAALGTAFTVVGAALVAIPFLATVGPIIAIGAALTGVFWAMDRIATGTSQLEVGLRSVISALQAGDILAALAMVNYAFGLSWGTAETWYQKITDAAAGIAAKITGLSLDIDMPKIDIGGLQASIEEALSGLSLDIVQVDFAPIGDQISAHLFDAIKIALPLVFGGGFAGVAVGAVIWAFNNDFLGFRTQLEQSGVINSVKDGLGVIQDTITGFFKDSGEIGQGGMGIDGLLDTLTGALQPLSDLLDDVSDPIAKGMGDLIVGIQGFFDAFKDTETGNIGPVLEEIGTGLAAVMGAFAVFSADVVGGVLSGIGEFLPKLGEGISSLITAIDRLLGGDYSGALTALANGIKAVFDGFVGYEVSVLQGFASGISDIANLVGIDFGSVLGKAQELGANIINGLGEGLGDMVAWPQEHLITPITDGISSAFEGVYNKALELGGQILNGIVDALASLPGKIMDAILSAIPAGIGLGPLGSISIGGTGGWIGTGGPSGGSSSAAMQGVSAGEVVGTVQALQGQATGGPVNARMPYIVGERGPELFVPQSAGRIIPNNAMSTSGGGMAGGSVYDMSGAQIVLPNVTNARQFLDELETEARRRNKRLTTDRGTVWR